MDDELIDVFDDRGWHLGSKPRSAAHRDGDWHLAFHLWVTTPDGVLLQRRARSKTAWPGALDATAAGHLLAGEAVRDGLREAEEELGVAYTFDDLLPLGRHRVAEPLAAGGINREIQHVYAMRDARALEAWTDFDRSEVEGLVLVAHEDFAVLSGDRAVARGRAWDGERERLIAVSGAELVPSPYLSSIGPHLARLAGRPRRHRGG
jgi:isopentenyldiphosphate isomerase